MFEFFQGVANFFSTMWEWFGELSKFFDVVRDSCASCYSILDSIGLTSIVGLLAAFVSILLIAKILGK